MYFVHVLIKFCSVLFCSYSNYRRMLCLYIFRNDVTLSKCRQFQAVGKFAQHVL